MRRDIIAHRADRDAVPLLDPSPLRGRQLFLAVPERPERPEEWLAAVLLAGEAGLRIGEVLALKWEDLGRVVRPPGAEDVSEGLVKGHRVYSLRRLAGLPG